MKALSLSKTENHKAKEKLKIKEPLKIIMKTKQNLIQTCLICAAMLQAGVASGAETVTEIAAGGSHSLFLKNDGTLWAMGYNGFGQLGDGTPADVHLPKPVVFGNNTTIAGGGFHSLFLKSGGSLWAMGRNVEGQLGDGTSNPSNNIPEQIVASGVTAISAGTRHSLFIKTDGSLWAMGQNSYGQLGDGTLVNTNLPEQIVAGGVTAIAAGFQHSLFLKTNGSLWAMGGNGSGQLGDGTLVNTNFPEQIVATNVTTIAAGVNHSLFLKGDGSLWAMGQNTYGQLGDGTYSTTNRPEQIVASNVTAIAAGSSYSLFLKSDGSLWAMGLNNWGQLGDGTTNNTSLPERIVAGGVTAIAVGFQHSLFLKGDGSLWAMGYDGLGQLGDGTNGNFGINLPEQIVAGSGVSQGLFGLTTRVSGKSSLVQINPLTGRATGALFSFPLSFEGAAMTYCPTTDQFVICSGAADAPRLALVDGRTHIVTELPVTGLPPGITEIQAVTYYPPSNSFVVTCGPAGFFQNHLAAVSLTGQVIQMSQTLPFPDADYLVFNPASGLLDIVDLNDSTGVQSVSDPFGSSPGYTAIAGSPFSLNLGDPAATPDGQLLVVDDPNQTLDKLLAGSFVAVGPFNSAAHVSALAFGSVTPFFQSIATDGGALNSTLAGLIPGQTVTFQNSTNLQDWSPVQTNSITGFTLSITNPITPAMPAFFLRAIVQ